MAKITTHYQKTESVEKFKMLSELLSSIYLEMKEFSKWIND